MANTAQSKKRARQSEARYAINKARRSRIRTFLRKVEEALAAGNQDVAAAALKAAQPELDRGVSKGVLHKNTVARKMSRLTHRRQDAGCRSCGLIRPLRTICKARPTRARFLFFPACQIASVALLHCLRDSIPKGSMSRNKFGCSLPSRLVTVNRRFTSTWGTTGITNQISATPALPNGHLSDGNMVLDQ